MPLTFAQVLLPYTKTLSRLLSKQLLKLFYRQASSAHSQHIIS